MAAKKKAKKTSSARKAKKAPARKAKKSTSKKTSKRPAKKTAKRPAKKAGRKATKAAARKAPAKKAKKKTARKKKQIVGEGDYAASRTFLKDQSGFVEKNKANIPAMGRQAEEALDGPEGDSLRGAEATAAARSRDTF
jgi:hypothetical protein